MESEGQSSFVDSLKGERISGRWVVDRVLGQGGMGVVAAGRHPELGLDVAIKFMYPQYASDPVLAARFLREAQLAGQMKSPHVVRVLDFGKLDSGVPFLVMERLTGWDLCQELQSRGALPIEEAVDLILQVIVGLAEVHALGVVHRDLKPSNLFLANGRGARTLKVLDFGVSKDQQVGGIALTSTNSFIGTPQYMSPEQIRASKDVDPRSDIWALGVILYELLTAAVPFVPASGGAGELFGMILYTDATAPIAHRPDLPRELNDVVMRCLERESGKRFQNVAELANALRPFASQNSHHRILAATQALSSTSPALELGEIVPLASFPTIDEAPASQEAYAATSHKTSSSTPDAKRDARREPDVAVAVAAPTLVLGQQRVGPQTGAPVTTHAAIPMRGRGLIAPVALGSLLVGSMLVWVALRTPVETAMPDRVTAAVAPPVEQAPTPAASASATSSSIAAAAAPTASAALVKAPVAAGANAAPARTVTVRPPVTAWPQPQQATPAPRPAATAGNAFDLLQDRK